MNALPLLALACVSAWVGLVVIAQVLNPEQSALSMGMSGLACGRHGWVMKLSFVVRAVAALALVGAVSNLVPAAAQSELGLALLAVWGGGSLLLAAYDTDMPGDEPTAHGRGHAVIAFVAYVAVGVGSVLVSLKLGDAEATADVARWALPIALFAAVALVVQFAGFAAAARDAAAGAAPGTPGAQPAAFGGLGRYAGLLQRVFLGSVMLWTALVAAGI
jgi:hypothetical protein